MKPSILLVLCLFIVQLKAQITGQIKPAIKENKSDSLISLKNNQDSVAINRNEPINKSADDSINSAMDIAASVPCDTIFLTNGKVIQARDIYFQFPDIVFTKTDSTVDVERSLPKKQVRCIVYKNGRVEVVNVTKIEVPGNEAMFNKGQADAKTNYTNGGGAFGTGIASFFSGGILGLIPAAICSSTTPKYNNLGLPYNAATKNKDYMLGYTYRAKKIKQKRVWTGYFVGVLGAIVAISVMSK